jgi:4-hydroxy-3-polyprenylbenzoate decarboxylase
LGIHLGEFATVTYPDLQSFIQDLDRDGQLKRIPAEVDPVLEMAAIADRVSKAPAADNAPPPATDPYHGTCGGHALLFENVKSAKFPCVMNLYGSYARMLRALGVASFEELADRVQQMVKPEVPTTLMAKMKKLPDLARMAAMGPKVGRSGICQQVVHTENANLFDLPLIQCWPHDGEPGFAGKPADAPAGTGRYVTFAGIYTKHPETQARNVGMYRIQLMSEKRMACHWHMHHDGASHCRAYQARGEKMPLAIVFGGEPVLTYAATCPLPPDISELLFAGFLNGKGIELVPCKTIPLEVPASAEIVVEGWVDPENRIWEGPFGDHTGFYSLADRYPSFSVSAITHRRDPIMPATVVGEPPMEDYYLGKATERIFLPLLKILIPDIIDYHLPMWGSFHNMVFVKIKKHYPLQARRVMSAIWGAGQMAFTKMIVVVDDDVNVHDEQEVMYMVGANVDPRRDVMMIDGPLDILDHASPYYGAGSKMGIDATRKIAGEGLVREFPARLAYPEATLQRIEQRWREYGLE